MAIKDIFKGDTKRYKFTFDDGAVPPVPVDITGWEIWFTLKVKDTDADAAAVIQVKTTAGDDINDDVANGRMYLTLTSVDTDVAVASYVYDFQRVVPGTPPSVRTLDKDKVKVVQDVTRANV
jgi:hypothetical protein